MSQSKIFKFFANDNDKYKDKSQAEKILEKKEKAHEYEVNKRARSYQTKWGIEFPWLITDQQKLYCKVCRSCYGSLSAAKVPGSYDKYKKGPFVLGCTNLKRDALKTHSQSIGHERATEFLKTREMKPGESPAERNLEKLNAKAFQNLNILFRNCHGIAKNSRPFTDYVWLCKLDEKKGIETGTAYASDKSAASFTQAIAETENLKIEQNVKEAKFFSILSDGTTDISSQENEIIYLRCSIRGKVNVYFVKLVHVKRADAQGIYNALLKAMKTFEDISIKDKLIAFGCDGASVNTGKKNGVITLLQKNISPNIVLVHCMAHRLELCFKAAFKTSKQYADVIRMLHLIYSFYKGYLQRSMLKESFESLGITPVMPTRIGGTRWVGHTLTALQQLWKGYPAIVQHVAQTAEPGSGAESSSQTKAKSLLKQLRQKSIIVFAHFLHDVLNIVSKLSAELQRKDVTIHECSEQIAATIASIQQMKEKPGFHLRSVIETDNFHSQELRGEPVSSATLTKVLNQVIESISNRFADINDGLLSASSIADLKTWPDEFDADFGTDKLMAITDHYRDFLSKSTDVELELVDQEWMSLKTKIYNSHKPSELSWEVIWDLYGDRHTNCLHMIDLLLSLPASTAECERGFSQFKIIKTEIRNKLSSATVSNLLTIQLNAAEVEAYDATEAIHYWLRAKPRRTKHLQKKLTTLVPKDDVHVVEKVEDQADQANQAVTDDCQSSDSNDDSCYDSDELESIASEFSDCEI